LTIKDEKSGKSLVASAEPFLGTNFSLLMSDSASVYYDETAKLYYGRWETGAGHKNACKARLVEPKVFQSKVEFPGMPAIVTIQVTEDGEWHERYDFWMGEKDGWVKTQETVLKKVK
jgi:hypothetical protein